MNILTSTCGRLIGDPYIPSLMNNLLINNAGYQYYRYDVGKLLLQELKFQNAKLQIFHFFSHLEDDYSFSIQPNTTYLIINLANTFVAKLDQTDLVLYENGFTFLTSNTGKIIWKSSSSHEFKFILIALDNCLKNKLTEKDSYFLKRLLSFPNLKPEIISKYVITPKLLNLYFLMEREKSILNQEQYFIQFLEACVKQLNEKQFPHASKLKRNELEIIYLFKHILRYRMQQDVSVKDISVELGLNERRLRTGFRRVYGVSIFEFVLYIRMENAKSLIDQSKIKINKIANLVGYQSKFTFAAAFRKYFHNKPSYTRRLKSA